MAVSTATHILIYPFSASGHITPILQLAHRLLSLGATTLTVAVAPSSLSLLDPLLSSHPHSLQTLILDPPPKPSRPGLHPMLRAIAEHHRPILLRWFESHPSPPNAIISDYFLGWTHRLASQLGIPRIVFSPSGAFSISVSFSLWRDLPQVLDPEQDPDFAVSFPEIPNRPSYRRFQLPHNYAGRKQGEDPDWEFYRDCMLDNLGSWGAIFNSFGEVEQVYIDHVKKEMGHDRVWTVGPLLPDDLSGPEHEVLTWLDKQPDSSVIYVCFGSRVTLTSQQADVLAAALEHSGVRFVWCARESSVDGGFEDRVEGRGFVIRGWAPQLAILKHRAVAVFLTHCGWNSVLEGLVAGVVMLTWPMDSDQYTNAKLLVDQLGVGIGVGEGKDCIPDYAKLAATLSDSVNGRDSEKTKAKELSIAALIAVKSASSSDLVKMLRELKNDKVRSYLWTKTMVTDHKNVALILVSFFVVCSAFVYQKCVRNSK